MTWDWRKAIPAWDYNDLAIDGFHGWQVVDGEPAHVYIEIKPGDKSSRDIAIEWDDLSEGHFYYRDFTKDGMPFVSDGESYTALYVFQTFDDMRKFEAFFVLRQKEN